MRLYLPFLAVILTLSSPILAEGEELFGSPRPVLRGVTIYPPEILEGRGVPASGHRHYQPDNWIGTRRWRQHGDDVYNASGSRQRVTVKIDSRRSERFYFTVQNDGREHDHFTVTAVRRVRDYRLSYYDLNGQVTNVTSSVTTSGYRVESLSPRETRAYRVRVKPLHRSARRGTLRGVYIRSVSNDPDHRKDCVKGELKRY